MTAKVHIKTQGVRGTGYIWRTIGDISVFPNGNYNQNGPVPFINVDAFEGRGETYRPREGNCHIEINDGNQTIFSGSFDELKELIEYAMLSKQSDEEFKKSMNRLREKNKRFWDPTFNSNDNDQTPTQETEN